MKNFLLMECHTHFEMSHFQSNQDTSLTINYESKSNNSKKNKIISIFTCHLWHIIYNYEKIKGETCIIKEHRNLNF